MLATLLESRKEFLSAKETFNMSLVTMRDMITAFKARNKSESEMRAYFDEMCRLYENLYLSTLTAYVEKIPALVAKADACDRVKNEIMPALKVMKSFLEVANKLMPDVLPGAKFLIRKEARDGVFELVHKCIPWSKRALRGELKQIKARTDEYLRVE